MKRTPTRRPRRAPPLEGLLEAVVDDLDLGVLVCSPDLRAVKFANAVGRAVLAAFGASRHALPPVMRDAITAAGASTDRFTAAVELAAPGGHHYFARARVVGRAGVTLVLLAAARVRTSDLAGHLHEHLRLTCRQAQCAALVQAGLRNREIGERLGICEGRVEQHLVEVYQFLGVANRTGLAVRLADITQDLETRSSGAASAAGTAPAAPGAPPRRRLHRQCVVPDGSGVAPRDSEAPAAGACAERDPATRAAGRRARRPGRARPG